MKNHLKAAWLTLRDIFLVSLVIIGFVTIIAGIATAAHELSKYNNMDSVIVFPLLLLLILCIICLLRLIHDHYKDNLKKVRNES